MKKKILKTDAEPSIPEGCKIIAHNIYGDGEISTSSLRSLSLDMQFNQVAVTVLGRLTAKDNLTLLNATFLDYLLENQEQIPKKYRKNGLCFWGTIFQSNRHDSNIFIKMLRWIPADQKYDWRALRIFDNHIDNQPAAVIFRKSK